MTVRETLDSLFYPNELNNDVMSIVTNSIKTAPLALQTFVEANEELGKLGIYTGEQLIPYLSEYSKTDYPVTDKNSMPVYHEATATPNEIEEYVNSITQGVLDVDKLAIANKPIGPNHMEIIAVLSKGHQTLTSLQYILRNSQSLDGVRGRVSELVDRGIVKRHYLSIKDTNTGEQKQFVYHYLPANKALLDEFIANSFAESSHLVETYYDEEKVTPVLKYVSKRPMLVVELSENLDMPEMNLLSLLRELECKGKVRLTYQSYLADGKNGKFIVSSPEQDEELHKLYSELKYWFYPAPKDELGELLEVFKGEELRFDEIIDTLNMSTSLGVAYLTHLRKREIVEQIIEGELVVFNTFRFI